MSHIVKGEIEWMVLTDADDLPAQSRLSLLEERSQSRRVWKHPKDLVIIAVHSSNLIDSPVAGPPLSIAAGYSISISIPSSPYLATKDSQELINLLLFACVEIVTKNRSFVGSSMEKAHPPMPIVTFKAG